MTGTLTWNDLLSMRDKTIAQLDPAKLIAAIRNHVEKHNELAVKGISAFCAIVHDHTLLDGLATDGEMVQIDEFGPVHTSMADSASTSVSFPLDRFHKGIGWTQDFFDGKTPADMARQLLTVEKADSKAITKALKVAIYTPIEREVKDTLESGLMIKVKPFLNGDGDPIPSGPDGEEFDADTHTHYLHGAFDKANLDALITTVTEHGHVNDVKIHIAQAQEASFRALDGFLPYTDPRITLGANETRANGTLDIRKSGNRAIGIYGAAEVLVKPSAVANYVFCYDADESEERRPLGFREPKNSVLRGLRTVAENSLFPLFAKIMEHRFGVGVRCRTNGAVLHITNGGAYAAPNFQ